MIGATRRFVDRLIERGPATPAPVALPAPGLSGEDIGRLQATLTELLECKRLLDAAR
jgi:hypothetical protein